MEDKKDLRLSNDAVYRGCCLQEILTQGNWCRCDLIRLRLQHDNPVMKTTGTTLNVGEIPLELAKDVLGPMGHLTELFDHLSEKKIVSIRRIPTG